MGKKGMDKKGFGNVMKALSAAYRQRERAPVGERWKAEAIGFARRHGPPPSAEARSLERLGWMAWRLAPAAGLLMLLLAAALGSLDILSDYELTKSMLEDPMDFDLLSLWNA